MENRDGSASSGVYPAMSEKRRQEEEKDAKRLQRILDKRRKKGK